MLILIILKSFKKEISTKFSILVSYIPNFYYFKTSVRAKKFRPEIISTKEVFQKIFFFGRSSRSM